jgi:uncharacterized membrane protein
MTHRILATAALSTALGIAGVGYTFQTQADEMKTPPVVQQNMDRAMKNHLEKCYGINAVAKNDCAEGAHSCAGQATKARDPRSFVLLPAGDCGKIQGGTTTAM